MNPFQFEQLNMEEKEKFILSKLQWRNQRRIEINNLLKQQENKYQAEKILKEFEFFNGRYFDFYERRWKNIRTILLEYDKQKDERKSRYRNRTGNPYYL